VEHFGVDFRSNPVGCGPFKFAFWLEDVSLVLHRNEHYYQHDAQGNALPYLDAVQISFVRDITASYLGLLQGRYHFMSGIHPAYKDELLTPNGELRALYHDQLYLSTTPFIKTDYIGLLVDRDHQTAENKALNDVRVRRALVYATDREKMVRYLRNNAVYPANGGFVPPVLPGFEGSVSYGLPHSKEKARALLAEAGYQNGEGLETLVISTTSDYVDLCEFLQYEWGQIGVKLEVEVMAGSVHRERVAKSQAMMFRKSWLADYPDAENFLLLFHTKNFAPAGPNYTHFSNEWFDDQYDRALLQPTPSERQAIYRALDSLVTAEAPVIPLFYDRVTHFVREEVQGWHTNGVNMIDLTTVQLRED
jgi:peptide/nickel transport system substrate-binding protein